MIARRAARREYLIVAALLAAALPTLIAPATAHAWDSRTHRMITRLAIGPLPPDNLEVFFARNSAQLQEYAVAPDTVLRREFGDAEARRHYIDLEYYGTDALTKLQPDLATMERTYGAATLERSGILPWAIEDEASKMIAAWHGADCGEVLRHAGYLGHYVGDASQPLHTTRYYDGYTREDRGLHARLERSVDYRVDVIEPALRGQVHPQPITSVWAAALAEIRQAHALAPAVIASDRTLRASTTDSYSYTDALMRREGDMIDHQIADGASVLASIWLYGWRQAGQPNDCQAR